MKKIDLSAYLAMREGAEVLEADSYGEKVLRLTNGNILKLFRKKRLISSSLWSPYATRFSRGAARLTRRGIRAPEILDVFRIPELKRDGVLYAPVPGNTLRQEFRMDPSTKNIKTVRATLADFVRTLFDRGIYFRSLHLGNIVRTPDGTLGLIDIADIRTFPMPLPRLMRKRNLEKMLRNCEPGEDQWIDPDAILALKPGETR